MFTKLCFVSCPTSSHPMCLVWKLTWAPVGPWETWRGVPWGQPVSTSGRERSIVVLGVSAPVRLPRGGLGPSSDDAEREQAATFPGAIRMHRLTLTREQLSWDCGFISCVSRPPALGLLVLIVGSTLGTYVSTYIHTYRQTDKAHTHTHTRRKRWATASKARKTARNCSSTKQHQTSTPSLG